MGKILFLLLIGVALAHCLELASYYSNNMILQREQENCLWGYSNTSEVISLNITVGDTAKLVFAAKNKTFEDEKTKLTKFIICVPAMNTGFESFTFDFSGMTSNSRVAVKNVLFGDVYFCSGQSNMGLPVSATFDFDELKKNTSLSPFLRFYEAILDASETLVENPRKANWNLANGTAWYSFSAVCFAFGINIQERSKVPVGLVGSYWGGTIIEAWQLNSTIQSCSGHATHINKTGGQQNNPQWLWNGMVYPFLPLTLNGFLWYQGEQNSGNPNGYNCLLNNLIKLWRESFYPTKRTKPFGIVELSPLYGATNFIWIRNAQQITATEVEGSFVVSTVDMGDPTSPYGGVHSRNKTLVGVRSALYMLHELDMLTTAYSGPTFKNCCITNPVNVPKKEYEYARVEITLDFADGLTIRPTPSCELDGGHCCNETFIEIELSPVANVPPTEATIDPKTNHLLVDLKDFVATKNETSGTYSLRKGATVVAAIQHAWEAYPQCVLWNKWELPSYPFNALTCDTLCVA